MWFCALIMGQGKAPGSLKERKEMMRTYKPEDYRRINIALIVTSLVVLVWILGGWALFDDCHAATGQVC